MKISSSIWLEICRCTKSHCCRKKNNISYTSFCLYSFDKCLHYCTCLFQPPTSGLCQQFVGTSPQGVQPMASSAMELASWCLVGWWSMANIPTSCMNYRQADGNGRDWNLNPVKMDHPLALDWVRNDKIMWKFKCLNFSNHYVLFFFFPKSCVWIHAFNTFCHGLCRSQFYFAWKQSILVWRSG